MKRTGTYFTVLILATVAINIISCTPGSCFEKTVATVKVPFYLNSTLEIKAPDSLTISGVNKGASYLYLKAAGIKTAELPLDPESGYCSFILRINGTSDTISLAYDPYPHLISKECGYTYFFRIESVDYTGNIIDSVIIRNINVTTANGENIRILY